MMKKFLLFLASALMSFGAGADTFNLFRPVDGILVGQSSTYVTSAADATDVISLWSGTCDATTFLRGDGSCQTVSVPTGADPTASLGLSAVNGVATTFMRSDAAPALDQAIIPTWTGFHTFTDNMRIQRADQPFLEWYDTDADPGYEYFKAWTNGDSTAVELILGACGTGGEGASCANAFSFTHGLNNVVGTTSVRATDAIVINANGNSTIDLNGSTGQLDFSAVNTQFSSNDVGFTVLTGSGTGSWVVNADGNVGLNSSGGTVTVNGSEVCRANGSGCPTPAASANPTGTVGLSAVNGVASTYMRSDAAPPLSQAIAPTWSAQHIFSDTGTAGSSGILQNAAGPFHAWNETDGTVDNRLWTLGADGDQLLGSVWNDAGSAGADWLTVDRTGVTVDSIALAATTVTVNGQDVRDAAILTSGTLPVARGGTNLTASADDNVMVGNGTTWETKAVPDCDDTGGNHLNYDTGTNAFSCGTSGSGGTASGASATAGGTTSLSSGGSTSAIALSTEDFDTGNFHDNVTNNSRVILPSATGYASCSGTITGSTGNTVADQFANVKLWLRKNGTDYLAAARDEMQPNTTASSTNFALTVANVMIPANGTDYVEMVAAATGFSTNSTVTTNNTTSTAATVRLTCTAQ